MNTNTNTLTLDVDALWQEAEAIKQAAQSEIDPKEANALWNKAKTRMDQARIGMPVKIEKIP